MNCHLSLLVKTPFVFEEITESVQYDAIFRQWATFFSRMGHHLMPGEGETWGKINDQMAAA
jgi:hypothetical protein